MSRQQKDAQPAAQAGDREAGRVKGEVGVLRSSIDLWASITREERREGTYPHAAKRSKGRGDGSRELPAPNKVRELQVALCRKAKAEPFEVTPKAPAEDGDPESRVRENRMHGLMRGGIQTVIGGYTLQPVESRLLY